MHTLSLQQWAPVRGGARVKRVAWAMAAAWAMLAADVSATSWPYPAPATIPSASPAGFAHPNLGFTTSQLEYARQQVRADVEPYKTYYAALAASSYANRGLLPTNRSGTPDMPGTPNYNSGTAQTRMINDSWGALTQALLWYMTGDNVYRHNAMRIVRTWSNMDPTRYAYFPDAHIHNGVPLYRMLAAAEILRSTPGDPAYTAYNLVWSDTDMAKLTANLIEPMTATFFNSNERFMNQHNYSMVGRLAGAIFTNNRARYDEAVEWLTVNATSTRQDINGAILPLIPHVEADNPYNKAGYPFYQIQEMMRDQAHGGDNVDTLAGLLRMVTAQGTKVDPFTGKPSTGSDAVSVYKFGGNRYLQGANAYAQFMLGYQTPWADLTGGTSKISQAYRGRLYEVGSIPEVYNVYKYQEGVDVDTEAPYLATAAAHADGPVTGWGNKDMGPEAFLTYPTILAGTPLPPQPGGKLEIERKSVFLNGQWSLQTEGDRTFGTTQLSPQGSTVVVHDMNYPDRGKYAPQGLMVRTNGVGKLEISADEGAEPWWVMTVPDTHGQWLYLVPDTSIAATDGYWLGANIAYYKFTGAPGVTVDFDHVNLNAPSQLTPPLFAQPPRPATYVTLQGVPYSASYAAKDANAADTVRYEAVQLPEGATLDPSSGAFNWTPSAAQVGVHDVIITATDGVAISVMQVKLNVQPDRPSAFQAAQDGYDPGAVYTTLSLNAYRAAIAPYQQSLPTATDAEFLTNLTLVQAAVKKLELLNPHIKGDGSLNWGKMVTTTGWGADRPALVVDNSYDSYSGDLRAPIYWDFGENYRVSASGFGIQARYMFANRSQGANIYGSNDNANWTLLTSRETTDTSNRDFAIENIPVIAGLENEKFRYFMARVDHPGPPTDPAYPGISSYGELHIQGVRYDLLSPVDVTASVNIARSGLTLNRFTLKYSGTVTFTNRGNDALAGPLQLRLEGLPAGVTLDNKSGDKDGVPYLTLPVAGLAAGQTVSVTTTFSNPAKTTINYTPRLVWAKY